MLNFCPQPIPPYASALWDNLKACSRTLFHLVVAPSDPVAIAAMWCACVWAENDFPHSESCDGEVEWIVSAVHHKHPWQASSPDPTSTLYRLLNTEKIWTISTQCCIPQMLVSLVYQSKWRDCVLSLSITLLKAPSVVERYVYA